MRQCEGKDIPGTFKKIASAEALGWDCGWDLSRGQQVELWESDGGRSGGVGGQWNFSEWSGELLQGSEQGGPDLPFILEMMTGFLGGEQAMGDKINFQRRVWREAVKRLLLLVEKRLPGVPCRTAAWMVVEWRKWFSWQVSRVEPRGLRMTFLVLQTSVTRGSLEAH